MQNQAACRAIFGAYVCRLRVRPAATAFSSSVSIICSRRYRCFVRAKRRHLGGLLSRGVDRPAFRDLGLLVVRAGLTISPRADGNGRLAPREGTSVMFETGPKAADYVDEVTGVAMEQVSDTENGFAQFRITL